MASLASGPGKTESSLLRPPGFGGEPVVSSQNIATLLFLMKLTESGERIRNRDVPRL
jgi:hypothetical protein